MAVILDMPQDLNTFGACLFIKPISSTLIVFYLLLFIEFNKMPSSSFIPISNDY